MGGLCKGKMIGGSSHSGSVGRSEGELLKCWLRCVFHRYYTDVSHTSYSRIKLAPLASGGKYQPALIHRACGHTVLPPSILWPGSTYFISLLWIDHFCFTYLSKNNQ